jgi:hypothetical protein
MSFDVNDVNTFLQKANETISCDSECQQQNEANQLKQDYINAQVNLDTASGQLQVAEKNYVTFTQGTTAYNNLATQQATAQSQASVDNYQQTFNNSVDTVATNISSYSTNLQNLTNIELLYNNLLKENSELYIELKDSNSDILTNERKTYYEDQGISNLSMWYYVLLVIYIVFIVCFAILTVIYPSSFNWKYKLALLIFFIILPFISAYLLDLLLVTLRYIYSYLPKNANLTVQPPEDEEKTLLEETSTINW